MKTSVGRSFFGCPHCSNGTKTARCSTAENNGIRFKFSLDFRCPSTFLSKITCVTTNHTSRVVVNITFPVMDQVVKV